MRQFLILSAMTAALAVSAPAQATTVIYGSPTPSSTGDCTPSCTPQFQTVYSHTLFGSVPVSISAISYFLNNAQGGPNTDTYTIRLSTSANAVGSLVSNFAANVGADVAVFYVGIPATAASSMFTFSGIPFNYDPNAGDLLVDISHLGSNSFAYSSYQGSNALAQRVFSFGTTGSGYADWPGYAIATQFTVGDPVNGAVPEPASWAMLLLGFGVIGAAARRRQNGAMATA